MKNERVGGYGGLPPEGLCTPPTALPLALAPTTPLRAEYAEERPRCAVKWLACVSKSASWILIAHESDLSPDLSGLNVAMCGDDGAVRNGGDCG